MLSILNIGNQSGISESGSDSGKVSRFVSGTIALMLMSQLADAQVYRCNDQGRVVFSDKPCAENAETIEINVNAVKTNPVKTKKQGQQREPETQFKRAISRGDLATVKSLVKQETSLATSTLKSRGKTTTPLHLAARAGYLPTVEFLIEKGADTSARDSDGEPVFHSAFRHPRVTGNELEARKALRRYLLDAGAEPDLSMSKGTMLLRSAASDDDVYVVSWMLERNPGETELVAAMGSAAKRDRAASLQLLIDAGADVNSRLFGGHHILDAVKHNSVGAFDVMVAAGANLIGPNIRPVHVAAEKGHIEVAKRSLKHKVPVDERRGTHEETPMMVAIEHGQAEFLQWLLTVDADISAKARNGETALHKAAIKGDPVLVSILLEHGADKTKPDNRGDTAYDEARERGHHQLLNLLRH